MSRLVRNQGENLRQAMAQLKALATGYYSEYRPEESQVFTNRVMILGLANFTVGKTRQAITQMLDQAQLHNRKIDWSIQCPPKKSPATKKTPDFSVAF
jgi:hypothetical protein